jgi:sugar transferase (PEP-CTERM/EpsH1 system associated)
MKLVFVTPRFPYPPLRGDQVRSFNHIKEMSKNNEIHLVSSSKKKVKKSGKKELKKYCSSINIFGVSSLRAYARSLAGLFFRGESVNENFFCNGGFSEDLYNIIRKVNPDVVHFCMIRAAKCGVQVEGIPSSIDFIDALSLNLERKAEQSPWWKRWFWGMEGGRVRSLEKEALRRFDHCFVTSEVDKQSLRNGSERKEVVVVPNGVDTDQFSYGALAGRSDRALIFTGNMSYSPNVKAVCYFVEQVFPIIKKEVPGVKFRIVGAEPSRAVTQLDQKEGVEVRGFVESIAECLKKATVSVCPLQSGAGIQNKVLEAMSTGTPVVATPIAIEGIEGGEEGTHYLVGKNEDEIADRIIELLYDSGRRMQIGRRARQFIEERYTWEAQVDVMMNELEKS